MRYLPALFLATLGSSLFATEDFPIVPDDVEVALFAEDPLVRNPCAITFDAKGRLCVGMGPQYRNPKPETPGDSVWILLDENRDGIAERRKEFAKGFNAIQGLAWKGRDLWIANAPDLTVVRDLDGDDVADEYVRVYTDLGNLEHALHGLNFGPDGKLYMSKGNSKGLTQLPGRLAPKPFRDLWGVDTPPGTPELPEPVTTNAADYQKNYHNPADDWGVTGGILRCDDDGSNLEIVARGFRNPWDIAFDDGFDWLGTDNDQTQGDKFFAPFFSAHFGWGHAWSYDWKGDDHLPTAPSSGPLFEGSGTGVIFSGIDRYPEKYCDVFLVNDWLKRSVYIYRPKWKGAWRQSDGDPFLTLAHAGGGRSMPQSSGRAFDPVDIEIGPDGAIWIASWGRQYGAHYEDGELANEGRIYRIWPKAAPPQKWSDQRDPIADLGSHLPVWRSNAQERLIETGNPEPLKRLLSNDALTKSQETWAVWALGRIDPESAWFTGSLNQKIQSLRIQASRTEPLDEVRKALSDPEARVRLEAVLAIRQSKRKALVSSLLALAGRETLRGRAPDRIIFYAIWGALMDLQSVAELKAQLADIRPGVRLASFLALLEQDAIQEEELESFTKDAHPAIAALAKKRLGGKAAFESRGRPLTASAAPAIESTVINPFKSIIPSSGRRYAVAPLQLGIPVYTDRPYTILKVPDELAGETFLQTANGDADFENGISVQVHLKYPSTVFLADDARAENPPAWARTRWEKTAMILHTDDPKTMRLYKREFPAGEITLGSNRDGVRARKGNYLLIVRPNLLRENNPPATMASVLAAMKTADTSRGRDLFLSRHGADCAACHRLENTGNNHAPDLSAIGSRADATFLIESILKPSASITEGFAAQVITTKSRGTYSGILLQETGRNVTIAMTGGVKIDIKRAEISARETLPVSAMPAVFDSMLTAQQVADIAAYLLTKTENASTPAVPEGTLKVTKDGDSKLQVHLGETQIATFLKKHPVLTRPAFVNVRTPSGIPLTRPFPAPEKEDHAVMHPGLWISFGWLSGNDYWRLQSKVDCQTTITPSGFKAVNRYLSQEGNKTVCIEKTNYHFKTVPAGIRLDIDARFHSHDADFSFGDQEESGLAVRMAKPLTVQFGNGQIQNDRGEKNGAGTWGKPFRWIDYSGSVGGKHAGILIAPHPENPRICWAHSRDYGALVANPFPRQPKERREPYVQTPVKKGEPFRLRYSVLLHESTTPLDLEAAAASLLND